MLEEDFYNDFNDEEEGLCPSVEMFAGLILSDKPFGFIWKRDLMIDWLRKIGYKIIEKPNPDPRLSDIPIQVAVHKDNDKMPDLNESNIDEVFCKEVQNTILNWLLKIR